MGPTIFISTGEASGDLHGAKVAAALRRRRPDCRVVGMGGDGMRAAGVEILVDNADLGVVGLWEVLAHGRAIWRAYRTVKSWLIAERPDVVVLIDYPEFHFQVARLARRLGLRVVYYISPQVWAWRRGRVRTLARLIDQMIVVLPFEVEVYRSAGIACALVGHPMLDELESAPDRATVRARWGLTPSQPVIGLFPGSRVAEVRRHLPVMLAAVGRVARKHPGLTVLLGQSTTVSDEEFTPYLKTATVPITVKRGEPTATLVASDAVLVASGTITLQAGLLQVPMVIIYKVAWVTWLIARSLVRVPFVGLPNLIAGEGIVPELLQSAASSESIGAQLSTWLHDPHRLELIRKQLADLRERLGRPGGSVQAADVILHWAEPRDVKGH
ncbi:MAG: lipid-A-disaccharide synthase [Nitrospirae bacterium]|nr:lipid-A-disaccharide synthase [Nitrospirota bacterium]